MIHPDRASALIAEPLLQTVLTTMSDGLIVIDAHSRIMMINPVVERLWGYAEHELVGQSLKLLMPDQYHKAHAAGMHCYLTTGIAHVLGQPVELQGQHKDGSVFAISVTIREMQYAEQRLFVGAIRLLPAPPEIAAPDAVAHDRAYGDGVVVFDRQAKLVFANQAACALLGYSWPELEQCAITELVAAYDPAQVERRWAELQLGTALVAEERLRHKNGSVLTIEVSAHMLPNGTIQAMLHDRSEAARTGQLDRSYRQVLESIATGMPLLTILDHICRIAEAYRSGTRTSILLLDAAHGTLHDGAGPRLPLDYRQAADGLQIGPDVGSCGSAAFLKQTVIVSDIAHDPRWVRFADLAQRHTLAACWSTPILGTHGQVLGTFAMYYAVPGLPHPSDIAVITDTMIYLAGIAIEHKQAEEALKLSQANLSALINNTSDVIWSVDSDYRIVIYNRLFAKVALQIMGREIRTGLSLDDLLPPSEQPEWHAAWSAWYGRALSGEHFTIEQSYVEAGHTTWRLFSFSPIVTGGKLTGVTVFSKDITARKRTEYSLRQSEERFARTFEVNPVAVAIIRLADQRILDVNPSYVRLLGYARAELLGHRAQNVHMTAAGDDAAVLDAVRLGANVQNLEVTVCTKTGSLRTGLLSAELMEIGGEQCLLTMIQDITARKQAEHALYASEARLRRVLEANILGFFFWTLDGTITEANDAFLQMMGYAPADLLAGSLAWHGLVAGAEGHPSCAMDEIIRLGVCEPIEQLYVRKDGSLLPCLVGGALLDESEQGVAFVLDITVRNQTEQALQAANQQLTTLTEQLQQSRDMLRTVFDGLDDGMLLLDQSGRVLAINHALSTMLERPGDTLLGELWHTLCATSAHGFPGQFVLQTLHDGRARRRRDQYQPPHGERLILELQTLPLLGAQETVDQVILHVVDVTEQLQVEALALQNERLEATGKLVAVLAHELNTPLQSIQNCLYLVNNADGAEQASYLQLACDEIDRISTILRQLLDLHRPSHGMPSLMQINDVIERVLLLTGTNLRERAVVVERQLDAVLPKVWGRTDQLFQVFLNLVLNAIDAMPQGGQLQIRTLAHMALDAQSNKLEDWIICELADTGNGIPEPLQARIFDPFFTTKPTGSGLGLAICRKLIEQHGGQITVRSVDEHGSIFRIELPCRRMISTGDEH